MIKMMATTINSSMSENPLLVRIAFPRLGSRVKMNPSQVLHFGCRTPLLTNPAYVLGNAIEFATSNPRVLPFSIHSAAEMTICVSGFQVPHKQSPRCAPKKMTMKIKKQGISPLPLSGLYPPPGT
jgi:hypothetical protein